MRDHLKMISIMARGKSWSSRVKKVLKEYQYSRFLKEFSAKEKHLMKERSIIQMAQTEFTLENTLNSISKATGTILRLLIHLYNLKIHSNILLSMKDISLKT
jgi:tRNA U54 and U55 pseudouridine synthase Pus10